MELGFCWVFGVNPPNGQRSLVSPQKLLALLKTAITGRVNSLFSMQFQFVNVRDCRPEDTGAFHERCSLKPVCFVVGSKASDAGWWDVTSDPELDLYDWI